MRGLVTLILQIPPGYLITDQQKDVHKVIRHPMTFSLTLSLKTLPWKPLGRSGLPRISCPYHLSGSEGKVSVCNMEDPGSFPGMGRSPGEGHGNPLKYSCLENPTDGGAWWATVHGVTESDTTEQLHFTLTICLALQQAVLCICEFTFFFFFKISHISEQSQYFSFSLSGSFCLA